METNDVKMVRRVWTNFSFIVPTGKGTGRKTFEKEFAALIESKGGRMGYCTFNETKVVDRDPLVKMGQKIWVDMKFIDSESAITTGVFPATVIKVELLPRNSGYFMEGQFSPTINKKFGWHEADSFWVDDCDVFTSKPKPATVAE